MVHNATTPVMEIDAQTYRVRADGQLLTCDPGHAAADGAEVLPVLIPRLQRGRRSATMAAC